MGPGFESQRNHGINIQAPCKTITCTALFLSRTITAEPFYASLTFQPINLHSKLTSILIEEGTAELIFEFDVSDYFSICIITS